ncbi:MAG: penicillin-binding protein 1A [Gammaproteobacteria bacterium]
MLRLTVYFLLAASLVAIAALAGLLWYVVPDLPQTNELSDTHLQTPMQVFTQDGKLIAEFGEKRRHPVAIDDVPLAMRQAFLAAEDDRFYDHPGVDWIAIVRAALDLLQSGAKRQGGSTITMQVARNFFLSPEKTYERKLKEIVLALKIERELSKDQILELYLNKIFLGHRAYGVGAAAQVYYGKSLDELSLAQHAMIAGLPKAPSRTNPVSSPKAARDRRHYVLSRMLKLGFISEEQFAVADEKPITASVHGQITETSAEYVAEMVRSFMHEKFPDDLYTAGYQVYTTINGRLQDAANSALQKALINFSRRHGYRGPEHHIEIADQDEEQLKSLLEGYLELGGLKPALVTALEQNTATVLTRSGEKVTLPWEGLSWARKHKAQDVVGQQPKTSADILKVGDVIRIDWVEPLPEDEIKTDTSAAGRMGYWRLAEIPQVEGALVSLKSRNGAIQSLVGGFDFNKSKFNRVMQAQRQPGSNFKPFVYSAALEHGFTAASFINDAPIVFEVPGLEEAAWRPENYSGKYFGPTRLRVALTKSRNLVSIRLLRAIGIDNAIDHVRKFGIDTARVPRNLSLSLGSGEITPLELANAYAVLSNGGYLVEPFFIERITDKFGEQVYLADPPTVCATCPESDSTVVSSDDLLINDKTVASVASIEQHADPLGMPSPKLAPRTLRADNAWIISSILRDVITSGTGRRALALKRKDIAGKTGTTNDQKDAWFSGFNADIVTTTWVGFDNSISLGRRETGARAALPMWIDYMREALKDSPEFIPEKPPGLITVKIDPTTGKLASANNKNAIYESFREGQQPERSKTINTPMPFDSRREEAEQLF